MTGEQEAQGSVTILSMAPEPGSSLRAGESVNLMVKCQYSLKAPQAELALVVQKGDLYDANGELAMPLVNHFELVKQGEGVEDLEAEFTVPQDTKSVLVFASLLIAGDKGTEIVEQRSYKVEQ